jgi:hypothetical protein
VPGPPSTWRPMLRDALAYSEGACCSPLSQPLGWTRIQSHEARWPKRGSTNHAPEENDRETDGTVTDPPVLRPDLDGLERLDRVP